MKIVISAIKDCQQAGLIINLPLSVIIPFIFGSQVAPQVIANIVEHVNFNLPAVLLKFLAVPKLINDQAIDERLELVMRAIKL
jgi:hypothetical protein